MSCWYSTTDAAVQSSVEAPRLVAAKHAALPTVEAEDSAFKHCTSTLLPLSFGASDSVQACLHGAMSLSVCPKRARLPLQFPFACHDCFYVCGVPVSEQGMLEHVICS